MKIIILQWLDCLLKNRTDEIDKTISENIKTVYAELANVVCKEGHQKKISMDK